MVRSRKFTFSTPVVVCYTVVLALSFVMTVALGIWMNNAYEAMQYDLAGKLQLAHAASGYAFIVLALVHAWFNRAWCLQIFCSSDSTWRVHAYQKVLPFFVLAFLCVAVSGILITCGVHGAIAFHCGVALLFSVLAVFHITLNISARNR